MTDIMTRAQRSALMSKVRGAGNRSTELRLMGIFKANRIKSWRRGYPLPGKPDFVFIKQRLAIFVDGCFWHGCPIHGVHPKQNATFWKNKSATARSTGCYARKAGK
ncbi:MAG: very short patch repair endonuclease [Opitutaceae bacterium]|jgi:DNA mismatch endonuclease (patch repair protein)|nr:very short patch repair endonuclease [Opitutaceae bacterium]